MPNDTLTATPAIVRVHYTDHRGFARSQTGALAADLRDGYIGLVANEAAWADPGVCQQQIPLDTVGRVEVIRAAYEPTPMEVLLASLALTPRERAILDILEEHGGPVQWRDIADIVRYHAGRDDLEPHVIESVAQALKAKGRIVLTKSAGITSGIVQLTSTL